MTPSEYAFSRIMLDQGVTLAFTPRRFHLNGTSYTPDFYDPKKGIYYEVSGTRQAYHANKAKYAMLRQAYPKITLKVVKPDGTEIAP